MRTLLWILLANIFYLCAVSPRCYYDSVNYCLDSEHIPNIGYLVNYTIISYFSFLYEFHFRLRDYLKDRKESYHLKVLIILLVNMVALVCTFREFSNFSLDGVQTTIFVALWFIYCFIRIFYSIMSMAARKFGRIASLVTLIILLLVSGRVFYVNRI